MGGGERFSKCMSREAFIYCPGCVCLKLLSSMGVYDFKNNGIARWRSSINGRL